MEKSIESVWKEGFLKKDALVAPKLNNLYNQKSIHIIDKFKRMYRINRIAIAVFAIIVLPVSFISKIPYLGVFMFFAFSIIIVVSGRFMKKLKKINSGDTSYQYLISFYNFIKELISVNAKLSRFLYPYIFIAIIFGFWFGDIGGNIPGKKFTSKLIADYPDMQLVLGLPLIGVVGVTFIVFILALIGGKIGTWDLNLVYSGIVKKLEELINDMEELRN
ncbi:hypothetical protein OA501_00295 [Flavobacteriaceae bacterium]|nr:hypothetical protein [Flavobacteriaceae bacterium]